VQNKIKTTFITVVSAMIDVDSSCHNRGFDEATLYTHGWQHMWSTVRCAAELRKVRGDDSVAAVLFAPQGLPTEMQNLLSILVGVAVPTDQCSYNNIARRPAVFASPYGLNVVKCWISARAPSPDTGHVDDSR
jgi:hypothetical protein